MCRQTIYIDIFGNKFLTIYTNTISFFLFKSPTLNLAGFVEEVYDPNYIAC